MNRLGIFAYGLAAACIFLATARETFQAGAYIYENHSSGIAVLGIAGWFIATFGPLILSGWVCRLAGRATSPWLWHLLFIPSAIAVFKAGAALLFYATGVPDGDSNEGRTLIAGSGLLALALLVHVIGLVAQAVGMVGKPSTAQRGFMPEKDVVESAHSVDGDRRWDLHHRSDGRFDYAEYCFLDLRPDGQVEGYWQRSHVSGLFETAQAARDDALQTLPWLPGRL